MSEQSKYPNTSAETLVYEIRVRGHLDKEWSDWFEGLTTIREGNGTTLLICPVLDQAALHALLHQIRDLNLLLLSVYCVDGDSNPTTLNDE